MNQKSQKLEKSQAQRQKKVQQLFLSTQNYHFRQTSNRVDEILHIFHKNLNCLYQQQSSLSQKSQIKLVCTGSFCSKYPWICGKQQCQCKQDHFQCKIINSQIIISQLLQKLNKPIRKQYLIFWKGKSYLWQYMINKISQQKQIVLQIYENFQYFTKKELFQKSLDSIQHLKNYQKIQKQLNKEQFQIIQKKLKQFTNNENNKLLIFQSKPENSLEKQIKRRMNLCLDQKIIFKKDKQGLKIHQNCLCKQIQFSLINIQGQKFQDLSSIQKLNETILAISKKLMKIIKQYNQLLEKFQIINQQQQYQLLTSNMNLFEAKIFDQLVYKSQSKNKKIRAINILFVGQTIYKARQYKNSYKKQQKFLKQTSLLTLKKKWIQKCQYLFHHSLVGSILNQKLQESHLNFTSRPSIALKRFNILKMNMDKNEQYIKASFINLQKKKYSKGINIIIESKRLFNQEQQFLEPFIIKRQKSSFSQIAFIKQNTKLERLFDENLQDLFKRNKQLCQNLDVEICFGSFTLIKNEFTQSYIVTKKNKVNSINISQYEKNYIKSPQKRLLEILAFKMFNHDNILNFNLEDYKKLKKYQYLKQKYASFQQNLKIDILSIKYPIDQESKKIICKLNQKNIKKIQKLIFYRNMGYEVDKTFLNIKYEQQNQCYQKLSKLNIKVLHLNKQVQSNENLLNLIMNKKKLKCLNIQSLSQLLVQSISKMDVQQFNRVKNLSLHKTKDYKNLLNLLEIMKKIQRLSIFAFYGQINIRTQPLIFNLSQTLNYLFIHQKCKNLINDESMNCILKCKNLEQLTINISSMSRQKFRQIAKLQKLYYLSFQKFYIKPSDLVYLIKHSKSLNELFIPIDLIDENLNENQIVEYQQQHFSELTFSQISEIHYNLSRLKFKINDKSKKNQIIVSQDDFGVFSYFQLLPQFYSLQLDYIQIKSEEWMSCSLARKQQIITKFNKCRKRIKRTKVQNNNLVNQSNIKVK